MAREYRIYKGLMKPVEFKGLRAQYIVIAGVGVLLGMILCLAVSILVGLAVIVLSLFVSLYLNGKYGASGFSVMMAGRGCATYIQSGRRVYKMLSDGKRD